MWEWDSQRACCSTGEIADGGWVGEVDVSILHSSYQQWNSQTYEKTFAVDRMWAWQRQCVFHLYQSSELRIYLQSYLSQIEHHI